MFTEKKYLKKHFGAFKLIFGLDGFVRSVLNYFQIFFPSDFCVGINFHIIICFALIRKWVFYTQKLNYCAEFGFNSRQKQPTTMGLCNRQSD